MIVLLCREKDVASGEGETGVISVLKLSVCSIPVLHDTCDFSLLSFSVRVCYAIYVIVLV